MQVTLEITHTAESYVMMTVFNRKLADVLQHFVKNVSMEQYETTKDKHVKNATLAFCNLLEAKKLLEISGE